MSQSKLNAPALGSQKTAGRRKAPKEVDFFNLLVNHGTDAMLVVDREGVVRFVNPAAERLFARPAAQMLGEPFGFPVSSSAPVELEIITPKHGVRVAEMRTAPISSNHGTLYAAYLRDVTEAVRVREELRASSFFDELTGLHNRRGFLTLAQQQIKVAKRAGWGLMAIFADLDGMKQINDQLGHAEGDQALIDAAQVLTESFRLSDIVARFGGDEFAVLALETKDWHAQAISARLENQLAAFNAQANRPFILELSMGIAPYDPDRPCPLEELLTRADTLMYQHKRSKGQMKVIRN